MKRLMLQFGSKIAALRVVDVDDGGLQARPGKQLALGQPVGLHGIMVIQMVLREVGENGRMYPRAVQTVFFYADGRGLHHASADALIGPLPQMVLQHHRIGRRESGCLRIEPAIDATADAQGAHHAGACRECFGQRLRQPPGRAGFAIGAGDGYHVQRLRRLAVERRCDGARVIAQTLVQRHSASLVCRQDARLQEIKRFGVLCFGQAGRSAVLQGTQNVFSGIVCSARPGDKSLAGLQQTAVSLQAAGVRAQPVCSLFWGMQDL